MLPQNHFPWHSVRRRAGPLLLPSPIALCLPLRLFKKYAKAADLPATLVSGFVYIPDGALADRLQPSPTGVDDVLDPLEAELADNTVTLGERDVLGPVLFCSVVTLGLDCCASATRTDKVDEGYAAVHLHLINPSCLFLRSKVATAPNSELLKGAITGDELTATPWAPFQAAAK